MCGWQLLLQYWEYAEIGKSYVIYDGEIPSPATPPVRFRRFHWYSPAWVRAVASEFLLLCFASFAWDSTSFRTFLVIVCHVSCPCTVVANAGVVVQKQKKMMMTMEIFVHEFPFFRIFLEWTQQCVTSFASLKWARGQCRCAVTEWIVSGKMFNP